MVDIVNQVDKEVQMKNLDDNRKAALLHEMEKTVRSKLERAKSRIEAAARKEARDVSAGTAFRGFRDQITELLDERKEKVDSLGEQFEKEDKVFRKEQKKLDKELERAIAKLSKEHKKKWNAVAKQRNKLGTGFDKRIEKVNDSYTNSVKKVQNKMHDKFDGKMMYVSFSGDQKGFLMVKPVQLTDTPMKGLVSDHEELMDSIEKWNTFRVGVFSHPDFESVKADFDRLVKGL